MEHLVIIYYLELPCYRSKCFSSVLALDTPVRQSIMDMWMNNLLLCVFVLLIASDDRLAYGFSIPEYTQVTYAVKRKMQRAELMKLTYQSSEKIAHDIATQMCARIISVLQQSYQVLHNMNLAGGQVNDTVGNAFAMVVENTPLLMELALLFPDAVHNEMDNQAEAMSTLRWAVDFTRKTGLLMKEEFMMYGVAEQELYLVPRTKDYTNPYTYRQKMIREREAAKLKRQEEKKRKRKHIKGPKITPREEF
ncbi:unnamed protein product [Calicophoron daubneyi]|uniref:Coiled-coil domain-containing protein 134 n=1 Tax=Calicophoron daubneyi TaxID=300641 RepID=A0AAV2TPZ4_CALDB